MNNQLKVCCATFMALHALQGQQPSNDSTALQVLDEVVVSDSRFELKREYSGKTVIRIGAEELSRNQGKTFAELINSKSGIEIAGSRGRQGEVLGVFARGGRGRQALIVIDGVRVVDPTSSSQEYDLRLLPIDQVESIEIIKGASSTLYGANAATAVISITTKKGGEGKMDIHAGSSIGTNQPADKQDYDLASFQNNARLGGTLGSFNYALGISQAYSDNLSSLDTEGGEEDPFSRYEANISLGYAISPALHLSAYAAQTHFSSAYDESFLQTDAAYRFITRQKRAGGSVKIGYKNGEVTMNAAITEFNSENKSAFPGTFTGSSQVVDVFNKLQFDEKIYSLVGLNYVKDRADMEVQKDFTLVDPYVNLVFISGSWLNINAGTRLNTHSEYGNQWVYNLNPSFSIPQDDGYLKIMGTYATSYITPSLTQLFGDFGANPNLEPETNRTLEAGVEWQSGGYLRTSLLYFNRDEENFVFFDSADFLYRNAGTAILAQGLEAELYWIPFKNGKVEANYTFTERKGDNAIRIPKHKINTELGWEFNGQTYAAIQYSYTGARRDTDFNTATDLMLPPFSLVHLYASRKLMEGKLRVFLNAENILNTQYTEVLGFSARGRNLRLGFALSL
jgi:vitamin B12 transporter